MMLKSRSKISRSEIIKNQSEIIYHHLQDCLERDSPEIIIERFRYLFIKGSGYQDKEIRTALDGIIESSSSPSDFYYFLNRCCQIIISYWYKHSKFKSSIPLLIAQLDLALPPGSAHSKFAKKLRQLIKSFQTTDQYFNLKRLGKLIVQSQPNFQAETDKSVGSLIKRYPCLYQHCLLGQDSSYEFQKTIRKIQKKIQHNYDFRLSQYVTYRARLAEIDRQAQLSNSKINDKSLIKPVKNPTLISDRKLDKTLHQYIGKVEKDHSYQDLACNFLNQTAGIIPYQVFRNELYQYLTSGLNSEYCKSKLNPKISKCLQETLPNRGKGKIDDFSMTRACSHLLKTLILDSKNNPEHYLFIDMIVNMGTTEVIGFLLKIVLICPKVKPCLEQKFAILFSHYESFTKDELTWLINSLEKLQLAFSIHFGKVDFSLAKMI